MLLISEKWHLYSVRYAGKPLTSDTIDPPVVGQNINMKPCPYPFQYLFPGVRALGQSAFDPISVTCYLGSLALRNWFRFRACMCDKHSCECIRTGITHLHILSYLSSVVAEIIALTSRRKIDTATILSQPGLTGGCLNDYLPLSGYEILRSSLWPVPFHVLFIPDCEAFVACISVAEYREPSQCRPRHRRHHDSSRHSNFCT